MNENSKRTLITVLTIIGCSAACGSALAVDGLIEIDAERALVGGVTAGDAAGFPVEINEPGSYRLTSELEVPGFDDGIVIDADDVTLDLNGFSIFSSGEVGSNTGVVVVTGSVNVEVRNGTIRNFFDRGVTSGSNTQLRLFDLRVLNNLGDGIDLDGIGNHVERCTASGNSARGLHFLSGDGSLVVNSVFFDNTQQGVVLGTAAWRSNVLVDNNGGNANPQSSAGTEIGENVCGLNLNCP